MDNLKPFVISYLKKYRKTIWTAIFFSFFSYISFPMEPKVPTATGLNEVVGMPEYVNTSSSTMSSSAFKVNGILLNCDLGSMSGYCGCEFFSNKVNINKSVRANYFWQPTRMWYHYKVLHSLEQDGKMIVAPEILRAWYLKSYESNRDRHYWICWIFVAFIFIFGFREGRGVLN